jgi:hypothetical protein
MREACLRKAVRQQGFQKDGGKVGLRKTYFFEKGLGMSEILFNFAASKPRLRQPLKNRTDGF